MITGKVDVSGPKKLTALASELKYLSGTTFVQSLPTKTFKDKALAYLTDLFPVSSASGRRFNSGQHLLTGWHALTKQTASGIAVELVHEREKEPYIRKLLGIIDKGYPSYVWTVKEDFRFQGQYSYGPRAGQKGWVTLEEGRSIQQPARQGVGYIDKTTDYIETVLIPELRELVKARIESRLQRI
jgi:hypothetical protein